jgi:hypothetical protein
MAYHLEYSGDTTTEERETFAAALNTARKEATKAKNTVEQTWFNPGGEPLLWSAWLAEQP